MTLFWGYNMEDIKQTISEATDVNKKSFDMETEYNDPCRRCEIKLLHGVCVCKDNQTTILE